MLGLASEPVIFVSFLKLAVKPTSKSADIETPLSLPIKLEGPKNTFPLNNIPPRIVPNEVRVLPVVKYKGL